MFLELRILTGVCLANQGIISRDGLTDRTNLMQHKLSHTDVQYGQMKQRAIKKIMQIRYKDKPEISVIMSKVN